MDAHLVGLYRRIPDPMETYTMKRMAIGAALGGLAVYLYDPESGENRRERLSSLWKENRKAASHAGRYASEGIASARPLTRRIASTIGRANWPLAVGRARPAASLPGLICAAAIGGAAVYFMDPVRGSARRLRVMGAGRRAVNQVAKIVRPVNPGSQRAVA